MKAKPIQTILSIVICLAIAGVSYFYAYPRTTDESFHADNISYLDEKKGQVLELAGLSTAASVVISILPDDTATPVANQLSELSKYFIVILSAVYLEKFLVSVIWFASFGVVVPLACVLYLFFLWTKNETLKHVAIKAAIFSVVVYFVIPSAIQVDRTIEARNSTTLEASIEAVRLDLQTNEKAPAEKQDEASTGLIGWFKDRGEDIAGLGDQAVSALNYGKTILTHFVDAIAIMIVTSCVMPVLILAVFFLLAKIIMGVDIQPTAVKIIEIVKPGKRGLFNRAQPERPMIIEPPDSGSGTGEA